MTTLVSPSLINTASNISFTAANVSLGAVANLHITGGSSGYALSTDGAGNLSWVPTSIISNGTSNVSIATSGGNILFGVAGTANVVTLNTSAGWTFLDSSAQNTGMNFGRVTATVQGWNLP